MVILGISIGTRTSGIAILSKQGLLSWNTLSFKNTWSEQKGDAIVRKYEKYLKHHRVTVVVLKIPRISHHTDAILRLLDNVNAIVAKHGCMVEYKTQEEIKTAVPGIKNRKDLMSHTTQLYPVLMRQQQKELENRNSYHDKMFEAVLVAHLWKIQNSYPPD
jgi:RNase H-fold protein (predicted Holliday junction resolvase)